MRLGQAARALGLARQSVQRVADALETGGFVRYEENPRHRRARLVVPTAAGTEALRRIEREQRPWADAIGSSVGVRDLERLQALLDRLTGAVEAEAAARVRDADPA